MKEVLEYPTEYRLSSGTGTSPHELVAFDNALLSAGISNYNLLKVSSILPKGCKKKDVIDLKDGSALLVAYGNTSSNTIGELISSAVAVGIPEDESQVGVIMETSGHFDATIAEKTVREMVEIAMKNHGIKCREIQSSSVEAKVNDKGFVTVISAVAMW